MISLNVRPTIITIASSKGGVGKSTVCLAIAGAFVAHGKSVHIIDLDENQTVMRWHAKHVPAATALAVTAIPPAEFPAHLKAVTGHPAAPDVILIDVAGVYEKALLQAMGRSHLVIIPAQPSEPDIHEATKVVRDLTDLNENFHGSVPYRILFNLFESLDPLYQRHAVSEITRLSLARFETVLHKRAAYREAFMTGVLPHLAKDSREAVTKAVTEVDGLLAEIGAILSAPADVRRAA